MKIVDNTFVSWKTSLAGVALVIGEALREYASNPNAPEWVEIAGWLLIVACGALLTQARDADKTSEQSGNKITHW